MKLAKKSWIREVQNKYYADEIRFLTIIKGFHTQSLEAKKIIKSKKLLTPSLCKDLHLFIDTNNIVRLYTSIANAENLSFSQKFPILLQRMDHFTKLIIIDSHHSRGNMGG